jgi:hypothetical protein
MAATNQKDGAKELVERARAGDQNAMAMLQMVGDNARKGVPAAKSAALQVKAYISDNPAPLEHWEEGAHIIGVLKNPDNSDEDVFSTLLLLPQFEDARLVNTACVVLSMGDPWTRERIHALDSVLEAGGDQQHAFRMGVEKSGDANFMRQTFRSMPAELSGFLCAGHCIGMAHKLQAVRQNGASVGLLCRDVEWELGCV